MVSSRARAWALAAATVSVVVIAGLLVLPLAVRRLAVQRVEAMTGRPVALRDVDLNLFTRRLVFHDLAVQSADDAPPLVRARRIEARFRLVPLLTGEVHLDELHLVEPAVLVVRDAEGGLSAGDVIEHWRARAAGEPVEATIDRIRIERGRMAFVDHAVTPDPRWTVESVSLDARHIATRADAAAGRATARFVAAGAAVEVAIDGLHVRPFRARAEIRLDGLDIAAFGAYLPGDAALRLAGGRFSTRATVAYDADGRVHGSADSTLTDLALARPGQSQPFVRVPHVALRARDVAYAGQLAVAR